MPFDVEELVEYAIEEIKLFSAQHRDETFYAFAIDASLLCLNSVEQFSETLSEYMKRSPQYYTKQEDIDNVKSNTGDWAYQGFAQFKDEHGFDSDLYEDHYNTGLDMEEGSQELATTEYATAMDAVVKKLIERNAFGVLKTTSDFRVGRVEHSY